MKLTFSEQVLNLLISILDRYDMSRDINIIATFVINEYTQISKIGNVIERFIIHSDDRHV